MEYIFSGIIGYSFGAFPTAFLILKFFTKKNILTNGSESSGAVNAYRVSGLKSIGLLVFIIDFLKGLIPILIIKLLFNYNFELLAFTSVFAVLGHCFSVWLKFSGGKGIAITAGVLLQIAPLILIIWTIIWIASFAYKKNVHLASISSSILTAALSFSSADILIKYSHPKPISALSFSLSLTFIFLLILLKHYETIIIFFGRNNK